VHVRLLNPGDLPAHNVTLTVTVPADVGLPPGPQVFNVGVLAAGGVYTATFNATLQVDASRYFGVAATGTGYGLALAAADTVGVHAEHDRHYMPYWLLTP
jgi:hypothetical protein